MRLKLKRQFVIHFEYVVLKMGFFFFKNSKKNLHENPFGSRILEVVENKWSADTLAGGRPRLLTRQSGLAGPAETLVTPAGFTFCTGTLLTAPTKIHEKNITSSKLTSSFRSIKSFTSTPF